MAHSDELAGRIRDVLSQRSDIVEKKMFGGVGFLLRGNLLVGVWKESLVVRLGAERAQTALGEPHVNRFDITGRPIRDGYLSITRGWRATFNSSAGFTKRLRL